MNKLTHWAIALILAFMATAMPAMAQTDYTLQAADVTIDENGYITKCTYDFSANANGTNLTIPPSLDGKIIKGIASATSTSQAVFYKKNIKELNLPEGVEVLGTNAFNSNSFATLDIPSSVTTIGQRCFYGSNIVTLNFGNDSKLTYIESYAFYYNAITAVDIPGAVTHINQSAFNNNKITSLNIPKGVKEIGKDAFRSNKIATLTFEANSEIETIGMYAFNSNEISSYTIPESANIGSGVLGNNKFSTFTVPSYMTEIPASLLAANELTSVTFHDNVTSIGSSAFRGNKLASVTIPPKVNTIGEKAFENNSFTSITIPKEVIEIGRYAFSGNQISTLTFESGSKIATVGERAFNKNKLSSYTIPTTAELGGFVLQDNEFTTFTAPSSMTKIPDGLFYDNSITSVTFHDDVTEIGDYAFGKNEITTVTIPPKVTIIKKQSFTENKITSITIPSEITEIGEKAFSENEIAFLTFEAGNNLKTIGNYAFSDNKISVFDIPESVTSIGNYVFMNNEIEDVTIPASMTKIPSGLFKESGVKSVTFHNGVTEIGSSAFSSNELTTITLPSGLTKIGSGAFSGNNLTSIVIPSGITKIDNHTFKENSLASITFEGDVTSIGQFAFSGNSITNLTIPKTVTKIDYYAFKNSEIETLVFEEGSELKKIGSSAFMGNKISSLTLAEGIETVSANSFKDNKLTTLNLPNSIREISSGAFENNLLTSVTYTDDNNSDLTKINNKAFVGNSGLSQIELPLKSMGNADLTWFEDGVEVTPDGNNKLLATNFEKTYELEGIYTLTNDDVEVVDGYITSCSYNFLYKHIIIPNELKGQTIIGIGDGSIFENEGIKSVVLPSQLKHIANHTFRRNSITRIDFPATIETVEEYAFDQNDIIEVTIPASFDTVPQALFSNNKLTSITIPGNIKEVERLAFRYNSLETITIEEGVTAIREQAFYYNKVSTLTIPASVNTIEKGAFYFQNSASVDTVIFADNSKLTYIGEDAFYGNSSNFPHGIVIPNVTGGWIDGNGDNLELTNGKYVITNFRTSYTAADSYELQDDDVEVVDGYITSCSYNFEKKIISIPSELKGQTIVGIDDQLNYGVFGGKGIVSFSLPSTLKYIGRNSFSSNNITSTVIPEGVEQIGSYAFGNNKSMENKSVYIPSTVESIGIGAFTGNGIDTVVFATPGKLTYIAEDAFQTSNDPNFMKNGIALPEVDDLNFAGWIDGDGNRVELTNGLYIIKDYTAEYHAVMAYTLTDDDVEVDSGYIISCSYVQEMAEIIIPSTLKGQPIIGIGESVFANEDMYNKKGFSKVTLPDGIEDIQTSAFADNNISEIELPQGLKIIGKHAFLRNPIKDIFIPKSVEVIDTWAFLQKTNVKIESVTIEENSNLYYIGQWAFGKGIDVSYTIDLPTLSDSGFIGWIDENGNSVDKITDYGLIHFALISYTLKDDDVVIIDGTIESSNYHEKYNIITIPETLNSQNVTAIGNGTDTGNGPFCKKSIFQLTLAKSIITIGDYSFCKSSINNLIFEEGSALETIGKAAFYYNMIQELTIPKSVYMVDAWAFESNRLTEVTIEENSTLGYIGKEAFNDNESLTSITLPDHTGTVDNFKGWMDDSNNYIDGPDYEITDFDSYYFAVVPFSITFHSNGGEGTMASMDNVFAEVTLSDNTFTREGYTFKGWATTADGDVMYEDGATFIITADMDLYAVWDLGNSTTDNVSGSVKVYPNPVKDHVKIEVKHIATSTLCTIYNSIGKIVKHELITSDSSLTIDMSNYPSGVYYIKVDEQTYKVVKL